MFEQKPPIWYWAISALALVWNALGVMAYLQQAFMSAEDFKNLDPAQQDLLSSQPEWITAAFAIAVFAGLVGCVLLLIRKRLAVRMLLLSFAAVVAQYTGFYLEGYWQGLSGVTMTMPVLIPVVALGLIFFARYFEKRRVLT
jgi:cation transport ATPase